MLAGRLARTSQPRSRQETRGSNACVIGAHWSTAGRRGRGAAPLFFYFKDGPRPIMKEQLPPARGLTEPPWHLCGPDASLISLQTSGAVDQTDLWFKPPHTWTHTHTCTYSCQHTQPRVHACAETHMDAQNTHTNNRHICTHEHTHTHTHTHTFVLKWIESVELLLHPLQ